VSRVLVVDAPGVLYPAEKYPPNCDPITSGLRLVRALSEGYGVPVLVVGQIPSAAHQLQLKAWLSVYDVQHGRLETGDQSLDDLEFWEKEVLTVLGSMQATPPVVITANQRISRMLMARSVPSIQFRAPAGIAPDWGPTASSWAAKAPTIEE
jgi:hypothetical protein